MAPPPPAAVPIFENAFGHCARGSWAAAAAFYCDAIGGQSFGGSGYTTGHPNGCAIANGEQGGYSFGDDDYLPGGGTKELRVALTFG